MYGLNFGMSGWIVGWNDLVLVFFDDFFLVDDNGIKGVVLVEGNVFCGKLYCLF